MLSNFLQAWIVITSVASIILITSPNPNTTRRGFVVGLAGSPAWLLATAASEQVGMFLVSIVFALSYLRGIYPVQTKKIFKVLFP